MINPYHSRINMKQILDLQSYQYQTTLYMERDVAANSNIDAPIEITSLGHFMLLFMTGDFTTKYDDEGQPADAGICEIYLQLIDGSNSRPLFTEPVPANIILSPGRSRAVAGLGDPSEPLRTFFPFIYTFPLNGQLIMRIENGASYENRVRIAFTGIRIFGDNRQGV